MKKSFLEIMLFLAIVFLFPSISIADRDLGSDGNSLLRQCQDAEHFIGTGEIRSEHNVATCIGLVDGVYGTMMLLNVVLQKEYKLCWPEEGISPGQATKIVADYLRRHPASLHKRNVFLATGAFIEAYTCK
jgi:hypothetical protein